MKNPTSATARPGGKTRAVKDKAAMTNVDICTSYLLQKIESGEIGLNTRLGEPSLAREIGVDRGAVRAAFERLGATGILDRVPRSGTYLKQMSVDDVRSANQVRRQLEVLGAGLAAQKATAAEAAQLVKAARLLDELTETYASGELSVWSTIRSLEIEFHTMIARFSHNPTLLSMMNRDSFLQICFPFLVISTQLKQAKVRDYLVGSVPHLAMAEAIQAKDAAKAEALMRKHVEDAVVLYERSLSEHGSGFKKRGSK